MTAHPENIDKRIVVAITGASGAVYGLQILNYLREQPAIETHLVVSPAGYLTIATETGHKKRDVDAMADVVHRDQDVGATIASGSFKADSMIIAPCSMKTLAAVATGLTDNLISRAADVFLKERRRLILMVRETPLTLAHLRNMTAVTEMGGIICPPVPAFYQQPETIQQIVEHTVGRVLSLCDVENDLAKSWDGVRKYPRSTA